MKSKSIFIILGILLIVILGMIVLINNTSYFDNILDRHPEPSQAYLESLRVERNECIKRCEEYYESGKYSEEFERGAQLFLGSEVSSTCFALCVKT